MKVNLAVDIGASSGRHIVAYKENGQIQMNEVFRFTNNVTKKDNSLIWDIDNLYKNVKEGIETATKQYEIQTIGIDTWAVDYALLDENDNLIGDIFAYRDERTKAVIDKVHEIIPFERLYELTGMQFQPFNTIYQLYADKLTGKLDKAKSFLMMPDYLNFLLTGVKKNEYTNASSTGMLDVQNSKWSEEIIDKLGLPKHLFEELAKSSEVVGECKLASGSNVVNVASHDTASAFECVCGDDKIVLSSGTWSLMGVKIQKPITSKESMKANFTNEGGVGYVRYLKNIMGMWIVNSILRELDGKIPVQDFVKMARNSTCDEIIDVNEERFLAPKSMLAEFGDKPLEDIARIVYRSLAVCYANTAKEIEEMTGNKYNEIEIVGGGVKNEFLNELTEQFSGKKVIRGEAEATALGNIISQMGVNND